MVPYPYLLAMISSGLSRSEMSVLLYPVSAQIKTYSEAKYLEDK